MGDLKGFMEDAGGVNDYAERFSRKGTVNPYPAFTPVPDSQTDSLNRYELPGEVLVVEKGRETRSESQKDNFAFDIRNPDVAPDTSATKIWGS